MPAYSEEHATARDDFLRAFGMAMMEWSALEEVMCHWFITCSEMTEERARAVFYSARSFTGRRDMLSAVIPISSLDTPRKELLKAAVKKAANYSAFRNIAAHGAMNVQEDENPPIYVLADPQASDPVLAEQGLKTEQLDLAAYNIGMLRKYLAEAHPRVYDEHSPSLDKLLELIRELPTQVDSMAPIH